MNTSFAFAPLELSVVVVSADSGPCLRECVRQVLALTTPLELLLIDNASHDGVPEAVARAWEHDPRFHLIQAHANLGFGAAVNRAANRATGKLLLVLGPDCLIDQVALDRLLAVFDGEPKLGLLGAVQCDGHGHPDPDSRRRDPLLRRVLASVFGGKGERAEVGSMPDGPVEVEAVSGALLLMPRVLFERLDGFDEGYFLHGEDLDLCRRVRDSGWRVMLAGDVRVPHATGGVSRQRPVFAAKHRHCGMWRWFRKFDPAAHWPPVAMMVWLGIWGHFVLKVPLLLLQRGRG